MNEIAFFITLPIVIGFYFYSVTKERSKWQDKQDPWD
jgi:hypothetical protein